MSQYSYCAKLTLYLSVQCALFEYFLPVPFLQMQEVKLLKGRQRTAQCRLTAPFFGCLSSCHFQERFFRSNLSYNFTILLKNIYCQEISCSKMLHFEFRIQLENQSSSLIPAQKAVTTRLCRMSDENGDNGRLEVQTRQQPRRTDCEYTMLSQSTMICPTTYDKN